VISENVQAGVTLKIQFDMLTGEVEVDHPENLVLALGLAEYLTLFLRTKISRATQSLTPRIIPIKGPFPKM
jgi:hypothetical protein